MTEEELPDWMKRAMKRNQEEAEEERKIIAEVYDEIIGDRFKKKPKPNS